MFASASRLDLNVIVGPEKPGHIKSILSGHLPIIIDYPHMCGPRGVIRSALWRMRAALIHRDRIREIAFRGCGSDVKKFIMAANHHFPALESLIFSILHNDEPEIPATFLRGRDRSAISLRRLALYGSPAFVSGLLSSVTGLTNLALQFTPNDSLFNPSYASSLLACLQGMQSLRSLDLITSFHIQDLPKSGQLIPNGTTVPILGLRRFHYSGLITFLNNLMSKLSAPSLEDVDFVLNKSPLLYLPRVIDDVRDEFRSVSVTFDMNHFHLLSSSHLGEIDHFKPTSFKFYANCSPSSIGSMSGTPSTKLAMTEELTLNFPVSDVIVEYGDIFSMRQFLRQFRSVRLLRVNPFVPPIGLYLKQDDDGEAIMPVLEKIELSIPPSRPLSNVSDAAVYRHRSAEALAAFEPCARAGRPVKVYYRQQTQMQAKNASRGDTGRENHTTECLP